MKLIAQVVARNEASRYLVDMLTHLTYIADEIIFTDDCSDDDTPKIAEEYGCRVYRMPEPTFTTNESLLRSTAWSHLCEHATIGDWILAIDADEKLYGTAMLPELMAQQLYDIIAITFVHMWNETQYRIDKAWAPTMSSRMFRFYPGGRFSQRRLACGSEPTYVQDLISAGRMLKTSPLIMQHLGYVRDEDKQAKYERYMQLDGGDFHSRSHIESILDPNPTLTIWTPPNA